jgi:hypothetical protein
MALALPNDMGLPQAVVEGTVTGGPGRRADQDLPVDFWLYKYKASICLAGLLSLNCTSSRATSWCGRWSFAYAGIPMIGRNAYSLIVGRKQGAGTPLATKPYSVQKFGR